ncbi:THUMP-like domain-containing protein [Ekhidna sp.]|uniref:THUMP-like domain-containing protein n=1 Tax=Ekhidna sp. TaxID=2608089 RepID=UPI003BAD3761
MNNIDLLQSDEVKRFIKENVETDPSGLLLNPPKNFKNHIKEIVNQIIARKKAKGKLDDWATNFELVMPAPLSIEQASSQTTCTYKQNLISGDYLVDLTGGMGIDCLALSSSFNRTIYVEQDPALCEIFRYNSLVLDYAVEIKNMEALDYINSAICNPNKTTFYLDPARRDSDQKRVFRIEDCSPNLTELLPALREKANHVLVKYSPFLDIKGILNTIPNVKEVHIVSVKNDCKELLLLIDFNFTGISQITCVNLKSEQHIYSFSFEEEALSQARVGEISSYIFEPNASVMKAGAFNKICADYDLIKLGENTHLYSENRLVDSFPGKTFEVISNANETSIKEFATNGKINVITRNYPLSTTELKKKLKLRDGGDYFLVAFKDLNNKAKMVIAKLIHP